jgi:hypothetical protein
MKPCVQCKSKPAKWQEESNSKNAYCGSACQQQRYHLLGLKTLEIDDPHIIGLQGQDGTTIQLREEQAREMETVNQYFFEDAPTDDYMSLPSVTSHSLLQIQEFFKYGQLPTYSYTDEQFINLVKAANYLDFQRLLFYLMPEWVNKRPFPGDNELRSNITKAAYFYEGNILELNLGDENNKYLEPLQGPGEQSRATLLDAAVQNGEFLVVKHLLQDWRINPITVADSLWLEAAGQGHLNIVELLLKDKRIKPTSHALVEAAANGHAKIVELLLKDGRADPEVNALLFSIHLGHQEVVDILLQDRRVDPGGRHNAAITWASENGSLYVVDALLRLKDRNVDPSIRDNQPLRLAAENGHYEVVRRLLDSGRVDLEVLKTFKDEKIKAIYKEYKAKGTKKQRVESLLPSTTSANPSLFTAARHGTPRNAQYNTE